MVTVQFVVFVALILDIVADRCLIAMFAHRRCKIAIRPKFTAPEFNSKNVGRALRTDQ